MTGAPGAEFAGVVFSGVAAVAAMLKGGYWLYQRRCRKEEPSLPLHQRRERHETYHLQRISSDGNPHIFTAQQHRNTTSWSTQSNLQRFSPDGNQRILTERVKRILNMQPDQTYRAWRSYCTTQGGTPEYVPRERATAYDSARTPDCVGLIWTMDGPVGDYFALRTLDQGGVLPRSGYHFGVGE